MKAYILQRKKTEVLSVASKEIGLEENAVKTKYMFISHEQNAGQYHNITTGHKSFESVEHIKYWRTTLTYQNSIHVEIKNRFNHRNVCYHPLFYAK